MRCPLYSLHGRIDRRWQADGRSGGILGDTPDRSYADKLSRFNRFAEPEIRHAIATLGLQAGNQVLDAGCGIGLTSQWLGERVGASGRVLGIDLSHDHVRAARDYLSPELPQVEFKQGDIRQLSVPTGSFDLIWSSNTLNHLENPVEALRRLGRLLVEGGTIAIAQSALLPEMIFAWDERLEREVTLACRHYYRDKYGLDERATAGMRRLHGWLIESGYVDINSRTLVIERAQPLGDVDREYLQHAIFEGYWGEKVRPYLSTEDWRELEQLTHPENPDYALDRHDFHYLQTYTVVTGQKGQEGSKR